MGKLLAILIASPFLCFGYVLPEPKTFYAMSHEMRTYVLKDTWDHREKIVREIGRVTKSFDRERNVKLFFEIYHQLLLIDKEAKK